MLVTIGCRGLPSQVVKELGETAMGLKGDPRGHHVNGYSRGREQGFGLLDPTMEGILMGVHRIVCRKARRKCPGLSGTILAKSLSVWGSDR